MNLKIQSNIETFNNMIEVLGTSERELLDFIEEQRKEIAKMNKAIRQIHHARRLLKMHFGFMKSFKDKQQIIKICQKFPEIRTARQVEVIFYMVKGMSALQIAEQMRTCEKTVKYHKTNIYKVSIVKTHKELVAYYYDNNPEKAEKNGLPTGFMQELEMI